jgi:succinate dehydrogenase / fumarate reductase cytochrome b subunit
MANVELRSKRPLSPHLTVFRRYVNMMMSILHRVTGAANYFAILLPVAWLVAAASGEDIFAFVNGLFATPLGLLVLFGASWSLIHHALGGIRHFIWDAGRGFSIPTVIKLSWATIILSAMLTVALWGFALITHGGL